MPYRSFGAAGHMHKVPVMVVVHSLNSDTKNIAYSSRVEKFGLLDVEKST